MSENDRGREEVWLETYRPQTLADVVGQDAIVDRLESYVRKDDLPNMLFAGPAGVGKCVTGETPVLTDDGLAPVADVVGDSDGFSDSEGIEILSLTERGAFEYTEPSHVFGKTAEELVSVSTRDGAEMRVTPEHRLLVLTHDGLEWQTAASVEPGDRVVRPLDVPLPEPDHRLRWAEQMDGDRTLVHVTEAFAEQHGVSGECFPDRSRTVCSLASLRARPVPTQDLHEHVQRIQHVNCDGERSTPITPPATLSPELAAFVGLTVGGAHLENGRIRFSSTSERLCTRFERTLRERFGVEPRRGERDGVPYVAVDNRTLTAYLVSCFDVLAHAFDSTDADPGIGSTLLRADEPCRCAFLRAVCDAEGQVTDDGVVELAQENGTVTTVLSYLLATLGIPSRRGSGERRATDDSGVARTDHSLSVSGTDHLSRFEERVGFTVDEKADRLEDAAAEAPNEDTVPTQEAVGRLCERLNLDETAFLSDSLHPGSPGRQTYLASVSELVDAATERLETVQRARARLTRLRPATDEVAGLPAQRANRGEPASPDGGGEPERETGVRTATLPARGDRTLHADGAGRPVAELTGTGNPRSVETVQRELRDIVDSLGVPERRLAEETEMRGADVEGLLAHDDHEPGTLSRLATVADRLDSTLSEMASTETVRDLRSLETLVGSNVYLDRVETVEPRTEQTRVYDLTVPETRNYVAGTVPTVMHNTTSAIAVARELYGEDWEEQFLELNASDERGIDVVRDRVKSFARTSFGGANYRIIFLDEADALTSEAQAALRRTMEQFSNNVRFVLSCNYSSQIIDPIQSRCAVFRFSPLGDEAIATRVRTVADTEDIEITDDGVDALVYVAGGDMRAAINGLQAAAVTGGTVDEEAVFEITSTARPEDIEEMVTRALDGDFTAARSQLDHLLTDEGIAGGDIIDQLHRSVWEFDLDDEDAVRLLDRVGETDYRITRGANERIQLEALLASVALD